MSILTVDTIVTVILAAVLNEIHRAIRIGVLNPDRLRERIRRAMVHLRVNAALAPYRVLGFGAPRHLGFGAPSHLRRRGRATPWPVVFNAGGPVPAPAPAPAPATVYPAQAMYPPGYYPDHGWNCPPDEAGSSRAAAVANGTASTRPPTPT